MWYSVAVPRIVYDMYGVEAENEDLAISKSHYPMDRMGRGQTSWPARLVQDGYREYDSGDRNPYFVKQSSIEPEV